MVAASVSGLLTVGLLSFYMTMYRIGFVNQERNRINADMRKLTGKLIDDGRQANYFVMYSSISAAARDDEKDRLLDGSSGDLIVFVRTVESGSSMKPSLIEGFVCYFRAVESGEAGELAPVRRYELVLSSPSDKTIEELIPDTATLNSAQEVVELSKGLATEHLFFNFWGRSVMVNGQIFHGNAAKRVTETYNFTISPRG
jgi:hypothetical protein